MNTAAILPAEKRFVCKCHGFRLPVVVTSVSLPNELHRPTEAEKKTPTGVFFGLFVFVCFLVPMFCVEVKRLGGGWSTWSYVTHGGRCDVAAGGGATH